MLDVLPHNLHHKLLGHVYKGACRTEQQLPPVRLDVSLIVGANGEIPLVGIQPSRHALGGLIHCK